MAASAAEWPFLRASGFAANTLAWAGQTRGGGSDVRWFYAYDGAGLAEQLETAGLLAGSAQQPEIGS